MNFVKIKHKRKFKQYLRNLALQSAKPNKQIFLLAVLGDQSTQVDFYVTRIEEEKAGFIILAYVQDQNLFALHGFEFEDKIEKAKLEGKEYYKDFITVSDIVSKGVPFNEAELPEFVKAFWEDLL